MEPPQPVLEPPHFRQEPPELAQRPPYFPERPVYFNERPPQRPVRFKISATLRENNLGTDLHGLIL